MNALHRPPPKPQTLFDALPTVLLFQAFWSYDTLATGKVYNLAHGVVIAYIIAFGQDQIEQSATEQSVLSHHESQRHHQSQWCRQLGRIIGNYALPVVTGLLIAILVLQHLGYQPLRGQFYPSVDSSSENGRVTPAVASNPARPDSYADAVAIALPAVVNIYTTKIVQSSRNPLFNDPVLNSFLNRNGVRGRTQTQSSLGSGVIVNNQGYVLTNNHVINDADRIRVLLADGRERLARVIGSDAPTDLAVLKIDLNNVTPAIFADPSKVRIGDIVLAIGNPYGIGQTVTQGIVSATGRHGLQLNTYEKYIQTDAAINKGNSGGALINTRGELIGINSSLYSRSGGSTGIGFAIPMDIASYVLDSIITSGEVVRGWLGITVEEITPAIAEAFRLNDVRGLVLINIAKNGPAEQAGLKMGDIITHIDDIEIGTGNAGMHQIAQTPPGSKINIRAIRKGAAQSFLVTIGRRPAESSS